jgi:hypothetical protein
MADVPHFVALAWSERITAASGTQQLMQCCNEAPRPPPPPPGRDPELGGGGIKGAWPYQRIPPRLVNTVSAFVSEPEAPRLSTTVTLIV